jgi:hypothetical protein
MRSSHTRSFSAIAARFPFLLLVAVSVLFAPGTSGQEVNARLEPTSVQYGAPVMLVLEIEGDQPAIPDLSVLERDFNIVDRRSQRSTSVINNRRSARQQLTLTLIPRRSGELEVPPISIGGSSTPPLRLSVTDAPPPDAYQPVAEQPAPAVEPVAASEAAPQTDAVASTTESAAASVEISVEPDRARAGAQVVLTARVYTEDSVVRSQLRDPQVENAVVLPLGEDRYEAPREGERRSVYERRYALFPLAAGRVEIEPLVFEGWARGGASGGSGFPTLETPVRAASEALGVEVLPPAPGEETADWLPARSVALVESGPSTYRVRTGQPLERRITLRADGLMSRSLPAIDIDVPYQITESRREPRLWDERRPQGVIGTRQEIILLNTQEPGSYRLPPLRMAWWNTVTERWETAMLPARELVVTPAAFSDSTAAPGGLAAPLAPWPPPVDSVETEAPDEQALQRPREAGDAQPATRDTGSRERSSGYWLTGLFAIAWIVTAAAWWRSRRPTSPRAPARPPAEGEPEPEPRDPLTEALTRVRSAYDAADAPGARDALLEWGALVLPESPPSNLARLAQRSPEPLRGQILMLERAFFSPRPLPWERQRVWEHMRHFEPAPVDEPASFRRAKPLRRRREDRETS